MTVRSTLILPPTPCTTATAWTTIYTVPTGFRALIKTWVGYNADVVPRDLDLGLDVAAYSDYVMRGWSIPAVQTNDRARWYVLEPGSHLQYYVAVANKLALSLAGALLAL